MDNIFEKVIEIKRKRTEIERLEKEINVEIFMIFVNAPFKTELLEINYNHRFHNKKDEEIQKTKVYFPVLEVPEGYSKSNEEIYRDMANSIKGKYYLTDAENEQVIIEFSTSFKPNGELLNKKAAFLQLNNAKIVTTVEYKITINDVDYGKYTRKFTLEEMIPELLEEEMKLKDESFKNGYATNKMEEEYQKKLIDFGATKVELLQEQELNQYSRIEGTRFWTYLNEIVKIPTLKYLWYEGKNVSARLDINFLKKIIRLKVLSVSNPENFENGSKIADLQFVYEEPVLEIKDLITYSDILEFSNNYSGNYSEEE